MEKPFILGHESSGIVVLGSPDFQRPRRLLMMCAVGENVTDIKPGDRVALEVSRLTQP